MYTWIYFIIFSLFWMGRSGSAVSDEEMGSGDLLDMGYVRPRKKGYVPDWILSRRAFLFSPASAHGISGCLLVLPSPYASASASLLLLLLPFSPSHPNASISPPTTYYHLSSCYRPLRPVTVAFSTLPRRPPTNSISNTSTITTIYPRR